MHDIAFILIAYLIGSLSSALILSRLMRLQDPRQQGSGNAGATNMLRTAGAKAGLLVLAGDMLKGIIVIAIARWLHVNPVILGSMMLACVLGHVFPIFFRFKGGKGVATALAVFTATNPICGGICLLLWLGVASLSQYASLASIIAVCAAPLFFAWQKYWPLSIATLCIALLIIIKHHANIRRLINGSENKIQLKKKK